MMAAQAKSYQTNLANYKKQQEEFLERTQDPEARKRIEAQLESIRNQTEQMQNQESEAQAKEAECANQLRIDQGQLDQFEEQLDRLDRKLESALKQAGQSIEMTARR